MKLQQNYTRWCVLVGLPIIGVLIVGCVVAEGAEILFESYSSQTSNDMVNPIPQDAPDREIEIPPNAIKGSPEMDSTPPILHSDQWQVPVPVPGDVNTAGAEDSPFITPDGNKMFFFFTPDLTVPHEKQVLDGVTGIYTAEMSDGNWGNVKRLVLQTPGKLALDGCPFVQDSTIWFCSAR
jgi:hypothetical protein